MTQILFMHKEMLKHRICIQEAQFQFLASPGLPGTKRATSKTEIASELAGVAQNKTIIFISMLKDFGFKNKIIYIEGKEI